MAESVNLLLPKVGKLGTEKQLKQESHEYLPRPKKKGHVSKGVYKGRAKPKKRTKTLNRFDTLSDNALDNKPSENPPAVGLPKVSVFAAATQERHTAEVDPNETTVTLPQILMQRTNIWGKRVHKKEIKEEINVQLEIEGIDLPLPPPKSVTIPRNKQIRDDDGLNMLDNVLCEVADIQRILHCHIVGMPVEIKTNLNDNEMQVARPLFHCQKCMQYWEETSQIKENCTEPQKPVRGPKIHITNETAQLIKSVWKKRADAEANLTSNTERKKKGKRRSKTERKNRFADRNGKENMDTYNVDNLVQNIVEDADDYEVVLQHIAEGIARNAGVDENLMNQASSEITENLINILSGNKPDDPAMMELIEKYLGETELMILRAMVDSEKCSNKNSNSAFDNSGENANMLLDRLAVLKTMETKKVKEENIIYLSKLFKVRDKNFRKLPQSSNQKQLAKNACIDVAVPKEHEFNDDAIDTLLYKEDQLIETQELSEKEKQCVLKSNYYQKKNRKLFNFPQYQDRNTMNTISYNDDVKGKGLGYPAGGEMMGNNESFDDDFEDDSEREDMSLNDNYSSSFYSYVSSEDDDVNDDQANNISEAAKPLTNEEKKKVPDQKRSKVGSAKSAASSVSSQISNASKPIIGHHGHSTPVSQNKKRHHGKNRTDGISVFQEDNKSGKLEHKSKKSLHKIKNKTTKFEEQAIKVQKSTKSYLSKDAHKHTDKNEAVEIKEDFLVKYSKKTHDESFVAETDHIVYDVDDSDDYTSDEVDDETFLIPANEGYTDSAYDTLVDELVQHYENVGGLGDKLDVQQLKQAMQRGTVQKTALAQNSPRSELSELYKSSIEVAQLMESKTETRDKTEYILKDQKGLLKDKHVSDKPNLGKKVSPFESDKSKAKRKPDFYNKFKRADKTAKKENKNVSEKNLDEIELNKSELDGSQELKPGISVNNATEQNKRKSNGKSSGSSREVLGSSGKDLNNFGTQSSSKHVQHVAVGETHFGMQLDALANLPAVPNPLDVGLRRRSVVASTRGPKVVVGPKENIRGHHSRQIEDPDIDMRKGPKRLTSATQQSSELEKQQSVYSATTQVERNRTRRTSLQFSLTKKDAPSRTLIGGDQNISSKPTGGLHSMSKRPTSSKMPLPPIYTENGQSLEQYHKEHLDQGGNITLSNGKPVATVKPMFSACNGEKLPEDTSQAIDPEYVEETNAKPVEEPIRKHIIIPSNDAISVLSFTSSFSFSMFNLPNQYRQQNEVIKNYNNQVGTTKPKEFSQQIINKIPTKDKMKKSATNSKNRVVINNLNKKIHRKVTDPKPIARYVKKYLAPVKEDQEDHTETSAKAKQMIVNNSPDENARKLNSDVNIEISIISDTDKEEHDFEDDENGDEYKKCVQYIDAPDPTGGPNRMLSVYASVPLESQMDLNDTESVIIRVQEYS